MASFQLPSRRVVTITGAPPPEPRRAAKGAPLFAEVAEAIGAGDLALEGADLASLALADFHALRAILTRLGWLFEEPVDVTCRNCGAAIAHRPCAALPLGPFADRELGDPELDATLPFGVAHEAAGVGQVTLAPLTLSDAAPLHAALARGPLRLSPSIVRAMGIARIEDEERPARLARRLERLSDDAWGAVTELFLRAHYPPRLFSIAICPACSARNDVDAPYEREFDAAPQERKTDGSNEDSFPSFEDFDRIARSITERATREASVHDVAFVVEGGVAACDDGGEPLLGSYVPGYAGDMTTPSRAPEITVFYRTFRAMWDEDGPYDWRAELEETIEHELEHHLADLAGDDPVDEEERREIDREAARVHGRKELVRHEIRAFNADFAGFLRHTWPIWLLLLIATLAVIAFDVPELTQP